jgi:hypothetical protein
MACFSWQDLDFGVCRISGFSVIWSMIPKIYLKITKTYIFVLLQNEGLVGWLTSVIKYYPSRYHQDKVLALELLYTTWKQVCSG